MNYLLSRNRIQIIIWILLCLYPLIGMGIDLIAPSLPAIAKDLEIQNSLAKNCISLYLLGYALGNFITGFLTDVYGRKKLLVLGLFTFCLVSLIPVLFSNIGVLLLTRFLQGLAIGAAAVVGRVMFSDILPKKRLIRMGVLIGTMWGLGPILGPVIGGYLQFYLGWKAGFIFFAIFSFLIFALSYFFVPETSPDRQPFHFDLIKTNFLSIIAHASFMSIVILMGLVYSLIIIFHTLGPFLIQTVLAHSPVYFGHLAFILGSLFLFATFVCRFLLKYITPEKVYFIAINFFFLVCLIGVTVSYFLPFNIILVGVISGIMFFACGMFFPLSMGKGMSLFKKNSGPASAVMYLINIMITSVISFVISFIQVKSAIPLMWCYLSILLLCFILYWIFLKKLNELII